MSAVRDGFNPGSFRDPAGRVFERGDRIFRTVQPQLADDFEWLQRSRLLDELAEAGRCVRVSELDSAEGAFLPDAWKVLESERIPCITYPYEWPFAALKRAALFHLDLHLTVLQRGGNLVDASAYNIQFRGAEPVFIDVLSFRRYREGEIWAGHRQFCEQFLNPLLLTALTGVPYGAWYRGSLEGIAGADVAALLKLRHRFSWNVLLHVIAPELLQKRFAARVSDQAHAPRTSLPKKSLEAMLRGLARFVARLQPAARASHWADYSRENTYATEQAEHKRACVREFIQAYAPARVLDLGCNTGEYAELMLESGAGSVIGLESDPQTADAAFQRAADRKLRFLPLLIDAANPSPSQGWGGVERSAFAQRVTLDAVVALAFEHHLVIGRNVPIDAVVRWIVGFAPCGLIEFVPKDDATVQRMLALRGTAFDDYSEGSFTRALSACARIVREQRIPGSGRTLFWFERERG